VKNGGGIMAGIESCHLRLQQQIDCQLEVEPRSALLEWENAGWNEEAGTDGDEAPLKYLALVLLVAIEGGAGRFTLDRDRGATVFADSTYTVPKAPPQYIARSLEILREITGLEGCPKGQGVLSLGIRGDSLDLIVQKEAGLHIITMPELAAY